MPPFFLWASHIFGSEKRPCEFPLTLLWGLSNTFYYRGKWPINSRELPKNPKTLLGVKKGVWQRILLTLYPQRKRKNPHFFNWDRKVQLSHSPCSLLLFKNLFALLERLKSYRSFVSLFFLFHWAILGWNSSMQRGRSGGLHLERIVGIIFTLNASEKRAISHFLLPIVESVTLRTTF